MFNFNATNKYQLLEPKQKKPLWQRKQKTMYRQLSPSHGATMKLFEQQPAAPGKKSTLMSIKKNLETAVMPSHPLNHRIFGFKDCVQSIGVYFRVDHQRSFAAHIVAHLSEAIDINFSDAVSDWSPVDPVRASALKDRVKIALSLEGVQERWPQNLRTLHASSLRLCCENPSQLPHGGLSLGRVLGEAVIEWFEEGIEKAGANTPVNPQWVMEKEMVVDDGQRVRVLKKEEVKAAFAGPVEVKEVEQGEYLWEWRWAEDEGYRGWWMRQRREGARPQARGTKVRAWLNKSVSLPSSAL